MSNLHEDLNEANKHTPKGFDLVGKNTRPWKDELKNSTYTENNELPRAINFVNGTAPAPTTLDGDVYVLTGSGTVDSSWGTLITFGDWGRFNNSVAVPITPVKGMLCYDDTASSWMEFDGSVWATFGGGGGVTNLSEGTVTNTTVDVDSDTGTNATLQEASTSRAGVMSKAKWDEVEANNAKVSNVDTNLSNSTTATQVTVESSDGTDTTLTGATGSQAGVLTAAKFNEIVANNAKVSADGSVDTHSDVDTTTSTPSIGEALIWDGSNWVPGTVSAANIYTADGTVTAAGTTRTINTNGKYIEFTTATGLQYFTLENTLNTQRTLFAINNNVGVIGSIATAGSSSSILFNRSRLMIESSAFSTGVGIVDSSNTNAGIKFISKGGGGISDTDVAMKLQNSNVIIGSGIGLVSPLAKLHVRGVGATSGTFNFLVANNSGQKVLECRDDVAIGMYGTTPVVQATTALVAPSPVAVGGVNVQTNDTFEGYTLSQIAKALRNVGLLA